MLAVAPATALAATTSAADPGTRAGGVTQHRALLGQLASRQAAASPYLAIDTRANRLVLRDGRHRVLREARCATGAGRRFEGQKRRQAWVFATPRGGFAIQRKVEDPVWIRPPWAFLQAGEEFPVFAEDPRRFQRGVLGRCALHFAPDLMIHGTLYEVNLGKSITHGCVRVGAEGLRCLCEAVSPGWPVYVF